MRGATVIKAYWVSHANGNYQEYGIALLDDAVPEQRGLANTGYFVRLETPEEPQHGEAEGEDRAG